MIMVGEHEPNILVEYGIQIRDLREENKSIQTEIEVYARRKKPSYPSCNPPPSGSFNICEVLIVGKHFSVGGTSSDNCWLAHTHFLHHHSIYR